VHAFYRECEPLTAGSALLRDSSFVFFVFFVVHLLIFKDYRF